MTAMPETTDLQAALIGSVVALPGGDTALVSRDEIEGDPAFVRNRIRRHANDGTLLRKETAIRTWHTPAGPRAACTIIVLKPTVLEPPHRHWRPAVKVALTCIGGACATFGLAGIVGFFTADDLTQLLKVIAGGIALMVLGGILISLAGTVGSGGSHCPGCPDH